jgi:hypothetical protein
VRPDIARNNHLAFFALQREDGQLPCWSRTSGTGFAQIQMVVPIAATAWEFSEQSGDSELLEKAYDAGSRWDGWLRRYRDTRHTGLCEGFCTWDTGQDNSPRWAGVPNRCPDGDARKCPVLASLPRLCPDLSATVCGGRIALAAMARALGKNSEADRWLVDAHAIRAKIIARLYAPTMHLFMILTPAINRSAFAVMSSPASAVNTFLSGNCSTPFTRIRFIIGRRSGRCTRCLRLL